MSGLSSVTCHALRASSMMIIQPTFPLPTVFLRALISLLEILLLDIARVCNLSQKQTYIPHTLAHLAHFSSVQHTLAHSIQQHHTQRNTQQPHNMQHATTPRNTQTQRNAQCTQRKRSHTPRTIGVGECLMCF